MEEKDKAHLSGCWCNLAISAFCMPNAHYGLSFIEALCENLCWDCVHRSTLLLTSGSLLPAPALQRHREGKENDTAFSIAAKSLISKNHLNLLSFLIQPGDG